jgi:hypothetical protein
MALQISNGLSSEHQQFKGVFEATGRRAVRGAVMVLVLGAALGCGFSKEKKDAEQLAEQYFSRMRGGDVEGVLPLYSTRFYEATSRADWLAILESQRARCGTPKSHSLVSWNVFSSFGANSGVRTTLVYDVGYSSCRMSEKIIVFRPSGGNIQIQGHSLTPKGGIQNDKRELQATLIT